MWNAVALINFIVIENETILIFQIQTQILVKKIIPLFNFAITCLQHYQYWYIFSIFGPRNYRVKMNFFIQRKLINFILFIYPVSIGTEVFVVETFDPLWHNNAPVSWVDLKYSGGGELQNSRIKDSTISRLKITNRSFLNFILLFTVVLKSNRTRELCSFKGKIDYLVVYANIFKTFFTQSMNL